MWVAEELELALQRWWSVKSTLQLLNAVAGADLEPPEAA